MEVDDGCKAGSAEHDLDHVAAPDQPRLRPVVLQVGVPECERHSGWPVCQHDDADAVEFVQLRPVASRRVELDVGVVRLGFPANQVELAAVIEACIARDLERAERLVRRRDLRIEAGNASPLPVIVKIGLATLPPTVSKLIDAARCRLVAEAPSAKSSAGARLQRILSPLNGGA